MKIAFGCDHAGFDLKKTVVDHLKERGCEVLDLGTDSTASVDYPIYGARVGRAVASGEADLGVVICGTGIGISLAANKIPGIRCAAVSESLSAAFSRRHNNANVLSLGSRVIGPETAKLCVDAFLDSEFEGGRHQRRVQEILDLEAGKDIE